MDEVPLSTLNTRTRHAGLTYVLDTPCQTRQSIFSKNKWRRTEDIDLTQNDTDVIISEYLRFSDKIDQKSVIKIYREKERDGRGLWNLSISFVFNITNDNLNQEFIELNFGQQSSINQSSTNTCWLATLALFVYFVFEQILAHYNSLLQKENQILFVWHTSMSPISKLNKVKIFGKYEFELWAEHK